MKLKMKQTKLKIGKIKLNEKISKFETNRYIFDFQKLETIRSFGDSIYNGKNNIKQAETEQTNLLENTVDFSNKYRPR